MRKENHLAAFVGDLCNGWHDTLDAGRVGDAAPFHRHVEVDAQQHAFVGHVGLIESTKTCHRWRHISEARLMSGGGLVSSDLIFRPLRENANTKPKITSTLKPYQTQSI